MSRISGRWQDSHCEARADLPLLSQHLPPRLIRDGPRCPSSPCLATARLAPFFAVKVRFYIQSRMSGRRVPFKIQPIEWEVSTRSALAMIQMPFGTPGPGPKEQSRGAQAEINQTVYGIAEMRTNSCGPEYEPHAPRGAPQLDPSRPCGTLCCGRLVMTTALAGMCYLSVRDPNQLLPTTPRGVWRLRLSISE